MLLGSFIFGGVQAQQESQASSKSGRTFSWHPMLGLNWGWMRTEESNISSSANWGFQAGMAAEGKGFLYWKTGLFYYHQSSDLKNSTGGFINGTGTATVKVNVNTIQLPLTGGIKVLDSKAIKLMAGLGPTLQYVTKVTNNDIKVSRSDINDFIWGGKLNFGVGFLIFNLDIDYDAFFMDLYESSGAITSNVKPNRWAINFGVLF